MSADNYNSISARSLGEYKEKGSKFIAYAIPFNEVETLKAELEILRKEHPKARHWCYAYRVGKGGKTFRANDDGEPSGSAGKPILGQLLSKDLSDILVVVVRYFGGTKLGVPGLIHAYKTSTAEALENATLIVKTLRNQFLLTADYAHMGVVMETIKKLNIPLDKKQFEEEIKLYFSIPASETQYTLRTIKAAFLTRPVSDVEWDEKIEICTIEMLD